MAFVKDELEEECYGRQVGKEGREGRKEEGRKEG